MRFASISQALSSDYINLYYVDIETDAAEDDGRVVDMPAFAPAPAQETVQPAPEPLPEQPDDDDPFAGFN